METRQIKFKAKRLDNGKWEKGSLLLSEKGKTCIGTMLDSGEENGRPVCFQRKEVDPSTICQFTGLKDNYGVDIWEHDIITISKGREPCEVIFEKGCFKIVSSKGIHTAIEKGLDYYCWDLRVIDNKFDRKDGE